MADPIDEILEAIKNHKDIVPLCASDDNEGSQSVNEPKDDKQKACNPFFKLVTFGKKDE